jgi:transcriptional regulator with XRE-family HTH domain
MAETNDSRDIHGDLCGDVRTEIREFLSTRRAKISPAQAGLPTYGGDRRRVTGPRREEVALLAGISSEYYTRLERGNATGVSDSVIDGIAHALHLDDAERTHLLGLLRSAGTTRRPRRRPAPQQVRPTVQRVLDSMVGTPGFVLNGRLDLLAANQLGLALFSPIYADPVRPPNTARFIFLDPHATEFFLCLGQGRQRHRRPVTRRGRPRPLRPAAVGADRGAVDPQPAVPGPMGRPPRADPHHRHQALPPPDRRGPGAGLRVTRLAAREMPPTSSASTSKTSSWSVTRNQRSWSSSHHQQPSSE